MDWARRSDNTWAFVANEYNDVVDMLKVPRVPYEQQCELIDEWLTEKRKRQVLKEDGSVVEEEFAYLERIMAVRGDSTGSAGDAPMEMLASATDLPIDESSQYVFTTQSKNTLYLNFEAALFRDPKDELRFSYPADHPLAGEFESQTAELEREYLKEGEYLSVHHADKAGAKDDAPDSCALALLAAANTAIGEILLLSTQRFQILLNSIFGSLRIEVCAGFRAPLDGGAHVAKMCGGRHLYTRRAVRWKSGSVTLICLSSS